MKQDDVTVMCDAYRNGLVPLKAAALALGVYRRQKTRPTPLTVPDLIDWTGAKRSQAYEAVQMVNLFLSARPNVSASPEIPESRNPGFPDDPSGIPGQNPPPLSTPCIEGLREALSPARARDPDPNPPSADPEKAAVVEWAARVAPNLDYWTGNAVETWPAAWVRAVLERKAVGVKHTPSTALLTKILQDWTRAGECEYLAAPIPLRATGTAGRPNPADFLPDDWSKP